MTATSPAPLRLFVAYAHEDEKYRQALERHLSLHIRGGKVELWHDRKILGGTAWEEELDSRIDDAHVILLLVSSDFLASDYVWKKELKRALERHEEGTARVVPIFVRPCSLEGAPFENLQGFPEPTRPISKWKDKDEAFTEVVKGLLNLGEGLTPREPTRLPVRFERALYLQSFLTRLEEFDQQAAFASHTFIEPYKDLTEGVGLLTPGAAGGREALSTLGDSEPLLQRAHQTQRSLAELLRRSRTHRVSALLGKPGSGKSVLLRQLARQLAHAAQEDPKAPLPLYVPLGLYTGRTGGRPQSVEDFIQQRVANGPAPERGLVSELERLLASGGLVLLFDGMDEMPRGDFAQRIGLLRGLTQTYTLCRVLFACRIDDFPASQLNVQQIRLAPFDAHQVELFLWRASGLPRTQARSYARRLLARDSPLAELVTNPFLLSLVARQLGARQALPTSTAEVFQAFIGSRLEWLRERFSGVDAASLEAGLGQVALEMARVGVGTGMDAPRLIERVGLDREEGARLLDLGLAAGILVRDASSGTLRFFHLRVQEFFVAAALAALDAPAREQWLHAHLDDPWSAEVFVLVAQRRVELTSVLSGIVEEAEAHFAREGGGSRQGAPELLLEARLVLVGRMCEAAGLSVSHPVVVRLSGLLSRLARDAAGLPLPQLRRVHLLRATRGALLDSAPMQEVLREALGSDSELEYREAIRALGSRPLQVWESREALSSHLYRQAITRNYLGRLPRYLSAAESDPRLSFLRRHVWGAGLVHLLLVMGLLVAQVLVDGSWLEGWPSNWVLSVALIVPFYVLINWSERGDGSAPSAILIHFSVLLLVASALIVPLGLRGFMLAVGPRWVGLPGSSPTQVWIALHSTWDGLLFSFLRLLLTIGVYYYWLVVFLQARTSWFRVQWAHRSRFLFMVGMGAVVGLGWMVVDGWMAGALPLWVRVVSGFVGLVVIECVTIVPVVSEWARRPRQEWLGPLVMMSLFVPFFLLCALFSVPLLFESGFKEEVVIWLPIVLYVLLLAFSMLMTVKVLRRLIHFRAVAVEIRRRPPETPVELKEMSRFLEVLGSTGSGLVASLEAICAQLGRVEPPSQVLLLTLVELASQSKVSSLKEALGNAVETLHERLQREPPLPEEERLRRELPVLEEVRRVSRMRLGSAVQRGGVWNRLASVFVLQAWYSMELESETWRRVGRAWARRGLDRELVRRIARELELAPDLQALLLESIESQASGELPQEGA